MEQGDDLDEVDRLIAELDAYPSAAPGPALPSFREIRADLVREATATAATAPRRRRRRRLAATAVIGIALATTSGVAAARWTSSHTGSFGAPGMTENDTTEWLDASGDDFDRVAVRLAKGVPFPPGDSARNYVDVVFPTDGLIQTSGVTKTFVLDAVCAWTGIWLSASQAHDARTASDAVDALVDTSRWPSVDRVTPRELGRQASNRDRSSVQAFWNANCTSLPAAWANP